MVGSTIAWQQIKSTQNTKILQLIKNSILKEKASKKTSNKKFHLPPATCLAQPAWLAQPSHGSKSNQHKTQKFYNSSKIASSKKKQAKKQATKNFISHQLPAWLSQHGWLNHRMAANQINTKHKNFTTHQK